MLLTQVRSLRVTYEETALAPICAQPPIIIREFEIFDDCFLREGEFILLRSFIVVLCNRRGSAGAVHFFLWLRRFSCRSGGWMSQRRGMFLLINGFDEFDVIAGKQTMFPSSVATRPPILEKLVYEMTYMWPNRRNVPRPPCQPLRPPALRSN